MTKGIPERPESRQVARQILAVAADVVSVSLILAGSLDIVFYLAYGGVNFHAGINAGVGTTWIITGAATIISGLFLVTATTLRKHWSSVRLVWCGILMVILVQNIALSVAAEQVKETQMLNN